MDKKMFTILRSNILNKKVKEVCLRGYEKTSKTFKDIFLSIDALSNR